jgi:predicted GNAT family N-acyltransferase
VTSADDVEVAATDDPGVAHDIRRSVFVQEQEVPESVEFDDRDEDARHFVASVDSEPAGTARVRFPEPETAKVERVAVLAGYI